MASIERTTQPTRVSEATALAAIAGYVDAYGFISYRAFVSCMSGNTTQSGFVVGQGDFYTALPTLLAIVSFVIGVFAGTLLIYPKTNQSRRLTFGAIIVLLAVNIAISLLSVPNGFLNIAILSFAMGMLNTTLSRAGAEPVNLTFVTGTLNKLGGHLALAIKRAPLVDASGPNDSHIVRATILAGIWLAFLLGAVLSGVTTLHFGPWTLAAHCGTVVL